MRFLNLRKKEEGAALVLVMLIFTVVALLGTAVVSSSMGEVKQSVALDNHMRAYYLARSAADATMKWIETEVKGINQRADELKVQADNIKTAVDEAAFNDALLKYNNRVAEFNKIVPLDGGEDNGNLTTEITGIEDIDSVVVYRLGGYIYTKAIATVNGVSATAKVRLQQGSTSPVSITWTEQKKLFQDGVYAGSTLDVKGKFDVQNGDIVYKNGQVDLSKVTTSSTTSATYSVIQDKSNWAFPDWKPPTLPIGKTWSNTITPSNNGVYDQVDFGNKDTTVNIDTQGEDVIVYIKSMTVQKTLNIQATGTGKAFLFIDALAYGNNCKLSIRSTDSNQPNIFIILKSPLSLNGNETLEGYIYAPMVNLDCGGGQGSINISGALICHDLKTNGNITIHYYPPPQLTKEEFNGVDPIVMQTEDNEIAYQHMGAVGTSGKQWLKE